MEQNIQITPHTGNYFGDYVFEDTWIIVTAENGSHIQVTEEELIPINDIPIAHNKYIIVYYLEQKYWISIDLYFPI